MPASRSSSAVAVLARPLTWYVEPFPRSAARRYRLDIVVDGELARDDQLCRLAAGDGPVDIDTPLPERLALLGQRACGRRRQPDRANPHPLLNVAIPSRRPTLRTSTGSAARSTSVTMGYGW